MKPPIHTPALFLASIVALALAPSEVLAGGKGWITDIRDAMKQAEKEKKDLLLDFTGSDWCGWCIRLNKEVFDTEDFRSEAPKSFVLVELDFPRDSSKITAETRKQNEEWSQKFGVEGFPTIFLTDAKGIPYAQTGYQAGGAKKYLAHLEELKKIRAKRDAALEKAAQAKGIERAKALDESMAAVGEQLALTAYADRVKEIIALDADGAAGLRQKYQEKLDGAEAQKAVAEAQQKFTGDNLDEVLKILADAEAKYGKAGRGKVEIGMFKIQLLQSQGKGEDAAKLLDSLLEEKSLEPIEKVRLSMQRVGALMQDGKAEEALKIVDGLVADERVDPMVRTQLRADRARVLADGGKLEEALKYLDDTIGAEKGSQALFRFHIAKGELLVRAGRKGEAGQAFDAAADSAGDEGLKEQIRLYRKQVLGEDADESGAGTEKEE